MLIGSVASGLWRCGTVPVSRRRQRSGAFTVCFPSRNDILFVCARTLAELGAWQPPFQKIKCFSGLFSCVPVLLHAIAMHSLPARTEDVYQKGARARDRTRSNCRATVQNTTRLTSPQTMPRTPPSGFRTTTMWPSLIHRELLLLHIVHTRGKNTCRSRGLHHNGRRCSMVTPDGPPAALLFRRSESGRTDVHP